MELVPGDPLAHRALESLLHAEATVRRSLARDLEGARVQSTGFFVLVLLSTAGGELELRALRHRMQTSKANATEVIDRLVARSLVTRRRSPADRRTVLVEITPAGRELVDRRFPRHSERVREAFAALDDDEKRSLAQICRKLAA